MNPLEIRQKFRRFICAELLRDPTYSLQDNEPLITSGLIDSFSLAQIGVYADVEFGAYIPDPELTVDRMDTLNDIVRSVQEKLGDHGYT